MWAVLAQASDYGLDDYLHDIIVTGGTIAVSLIGGGYLLHCRTKREIRGISESIQTNHGKRPGEYLEMVADIKEDVAAIRMNQADMKVDLADVKDDVSDLKGAFTEHQAQDADNFGELKGDIAALRGEKD